MITLAIDTSTERGSVAIFARNTLAFSESFSADRSHSSALFAALERARECSARFDCVAVGLGPGSFAGVRIAIAAAMGFEMTLGSKVVGLPSVAALDVEDDEYLVIGDARREAFYFSRVMKRKCFDGPELVNEARLRELIGQFPALKVYASAPVSAMPTVQLVYPSAAVLAKSAAAGIGIVARDSLEPIYLREPFITPPRVR